MYYKSQIKKNRIGLSMIAYLLLILSGGYLLSGCNDQDPRKILSHDKEAPGTVSHIQVKSLNGAAKISYTIPDDPDLLYVQADYEIRPGYKQEVKASYYNDYLMVRGFGDTATHPVTLVAVDKSGNKSEPVVVRVKPLASPVQITYATLAYEESFGGIHVTFQNEALADLVVTVLVKDSANEWVDYDKNYTQLKDGDFSVRGLPAVPTTFGVFIEDQWDNLSDTLVEELTPYFEEELDKSKFKAVELPSDVANNWTTSKLWDDNTTKVGGGNGFSSVDAGFPVSFTIDLGVKAKISRFKTWQVHDGREYSAGNVRTFQIYGSNDPEDDWDSWTLLTDDEVVKPSGLPEGELSDEDVETAAAGDEFTMPFSENSYRYIRFLITSTFASPPGSTSGSFWYLELTFWGQSQ